MRGFAFAATALLALAACDRTDPGVVDAGRHDAFWLWAGVRPQPALADAKTLYILDGEILAARPDRYVDLRPGVPRLPNTQLWLVVRTDTLAWPEAALPSLVARLDRWAAAGNRVEGLQLDFDAATSGLDAYAAFLREVRRALPARYRLSITGLMDWSANGDPEALAALRGTIDEAVIQTYQGRTTIPGYEAWFRRMKDFPLPFRVGLVQGGEWREPPGLAAEPNFRGYVVFLLNPGG
ncbi:MAG TPA: DUF3142 domain-containing protein [Allosphingosinicella sp.]